MVNSVFITGAQAGMGLEYVRQFANSDHPPKYIFASDLIVNPKDAKELNALAEKHKNVHLIEIDVTNDQHIEDAVKLVTSVVGDDGLNLLINNAGIFIEGAKLPCITRQVINRHYDVNATSPLLLIQAFLPLLKKAASNQSNKPMSISKAAVVNISSEVGSLNGRGDFSANLVGHYGYNSSKGALNVLTKNLSADLKQEGILVVGICPGFVNTVMTKRLLKLLDGNPILDGWGEPQSPEESVTSIMATMRRLTDKNNGGYFRNNGEKIDDYDFAPATE